MLVMVPSIQRLAVYLGSPTYSLAIVLFTILVGSGVGSLTTGRVPDQRIGARQRLAILSLMIVVGLQLFLLPYLVAWTQPWPLLLRIVLVILIMFPAGFFMGQPFPLGIKWIGRRRQQIIPWLWAINGVASVIGSTLATLIGLAYGFRIVSLIGLLCYAAALLVAAYVWIRTEEPALAAEYSL
jgi:MFS family permease